MHRLRSIALPFRLLRYKTSLIWHLAIDHNNHTRPMLRFAQKMGLVMATLVPLPNCQKPSTYMDIFAEMEPMLEGTIEATDRRINTLMFDTLFDKPVVMQSFA
ncbi:hypothetical protein A1353_23285 [Methylomonas methanica]|uniref:Uncharacterized protein n=1 Tax=Methylomonas methanica TaxID=421 RepID=A0A177LV38_METMH|nr:hypothetical protein A1353_23285 [Methylomonas methanica]